MYQYVLCITTCYIDSCLYFIYKYKTTYICIGACLQNFTRVTIISNPPGTAVDVSANTFVYPIMSSVTLTCTTDPLPTSNVTYAWMTSGCTTCFPNGATGQSATTSSLTSEDAGIFTCSADGGSNSPTSSYQFTLHVSCKLH